MKPLTRLISDALRLPSDAVSYELSLQLGERAEGFVVLETEDCDFEPVDYANAGHAAMFVVEGTHAQVDLQWEGGEVGTTAKPRNALSEVLWQGHKLYLVTVTLDDGCTVRHLILAPTAALGEAFFTAVCRWSDVVEGSILVFGGGHWKRDERLMKAIAGASFDNLILAPGLRERLEQDVLSFFAAREQYERYGVAWKRGVLLLGPPGNGKTHALKALVKAAGVPTLYVRNFGAARATPQDGIQAVFRRARNVAPCMLVLEDLDSLVEKKSLSFFLNEMDGFSANHGILTIATTNHPDRLDPALVERPSRFDRKIAFPLPGARLRRRFLSMVNERWEPSMRLSPAEIDDLAARCDRFSFAYLKELTLSAMVAWMAREQPGTMAEIVGSMVDSLRAQMRSKVQPDVAAEEDED